MKPIVQAQTHTATCKNNKGLCAVKLLALLSLLLGKALTPIQIWAPPLSPC